MRIAVIGSGISGLASAYYLSRRHEVHLFEKEGQLGGHTNTVAIESPQGSIGVDTGFIVHNRKTYPNLIRLFAEFGLRTQPTSMSFGVSCHRSGFEYSSRGLGGFFAQRSNMLRREHYLLLREIMRFNRRAPELLAKAENSSATIGDLLDEGGYADVFAERYLYPMTAAVWSMSTGAVRQFPAHTLLRFFENHGMLGVNTHPQWFVLEGGSSSYLPPITAPFRDRIHTGSVIRTIRRGESGVRLQFMDRPEETFDHVVLACHGNQALALLGDPSDAERDVLGHFHTSRNEVCLHTDVSLLPRREQARASWNYDVSDPDHGATLTYDMNRLQGLKAREQYCVTMNATSRIATDKLVKRLVYYHPIYSREAIAAQTQWSRISGANRTHFCGAYWFYGFHEDGLNSALRVARALGVEP